MKDFHPCTCGLNFYHCDGRCGVNGSSDPMSQDWWAPETIGQRVRELRQILGINAIDLSKKLKFSSNFVSYIETNKKAKPSYESIYKIKTFFDREFAKKNQRKSATAKGIKEQIDKATTKK